VIRPGDHLDELLSAYLDGELSPADLATAETHLAGCGACRGELDAVLATRHLLRRLPGRLPPSGWYRDVVVTDARRRRTARSAATWIALGAAAASAILLLAPGEPSVAPPVFQFVDAHSAGSSVTEDPVTSLAPTAVPSGLRP
jgi:anti-sigma factor RsiW